MTKYTDERRKEHSTERRIQEMQAPVRDRPSDDTGGDERTKASGLSGAACAHHAHGCKKEQPAELVQQRVNLPGRLPAATDLDLIRQVLAGDEDAFVSLVRRYQGQLFRFIRRYLRDYDQACDVFQQVLLKLSASLPTLCIAGEKLSSWLFCVAHNCCLDELRKKHMVRFSDLGWESDEEEELTPLALLEDPYPSPEVMVEQHELQRALREAIEALPTRFRRVVLLRYTDQLSFSEIGQRLKMPASTAKSYFYRARPLLRATLTAQGYTNPPAGGHEQARLPRKRA